MPSLPRFIRRPWFLATVGILIVGYTAAGFWLVPRLVSSNLREIVSTRYHRTARLGEVTFNPFTLELIVNQFAIPDADGGALVSFERLSVRLGLQSVVRAAPEFKSIELDAPRLRVVRRADGRINLLDLAPPPDPKAGPPADPNAPPPRLWIDTFSIRGGEATVIDLARRTPLTLEFKPISFTLGNFSTRSEGNAYALAARSGAGEGLEWHGTFGLAPVASRGSFAVTKLHATTLAAIGAEQVPFEITGGEINLNGTYDLAERGENLSLEAKLAELLVTTLGIRAHGDSADVVQVPKLALTDTSFNLIAQSIVVGHVLIEQPHLSAVRSRDGKLSLLRLLPAAPPAAVAPPAAATAPAAAQPAAKPWMVSVPDIRLNAADLTFEDQTSAGSANFHLGPVDVTVSDYALPAGKPLGVDATAVINDTGHVSAKGTVTLDPLTAKLAIVAATLPLPSLQTYADASTSLVIKSGTAGLSGTLVLDAKGAIGFEGSAGVDGLETADRALDQDFVKWRQVAVAGLKLRTSPLSVRIREVQVHEPYARVIIGANGITNIKEVLAPRAAAADAAAIAANADAKAAAPATAEKRSVELPPQPPRAALPVEIGIVTIDKGSMNFADLSIKPNFDTGIQDLAGTIKGLSGRADARADIDMNGNVDRYSPVKITGTVNYFSAISHLDLTAKFSNLELTNLSPYSGRFAGYAIERGKMTVDLNYKVENRQLDAKHRITINQLQLGDKVDSPEATSLPVKLAIALLKDRNGVIDLDLPVNGSLDDPKFRIGPLVWKVIVNLFSKAVTAPFALLGSLFGGGEEMSYIDFPAGSAALDAASKVKLQGLVKALDARPALNLDLPPVVQPEADRAALTEARWHESIAARARTRLGAHAADPGAIEHLLATPKDYRALLEDAYREGFGHKPDIPKPAADADAAGKDPAAQAIAWLEGELKGKISVAADDLDALGQARAAGVQAAILTGTGIDPGRVFLIAAKPLPAAATVRMQLELH